VKSHHMKVHALGINGMAAQLARDVACRVRDRLLDQRLRSSLAEPARPNPWPSALRAFWAFPIFRPQTTAFRIEESFRMLESIIEST